MEQEIVKVPQNEAVVALARSQAAVASRVDLEHDLAIHQQGEKLESRKTVQPTEPFDLLRCRQCGDCGRDLRIANSEQRAGARRFQDHVVAAPSHVREPREDKNVGVAELRRSRPIVGDLRLDDDLVLPVSRPPEAVLQQALPGQTLDQSMNLLVDAPPAGLEGGEWQTHSQVLRALSYARAERSQADRIAIEMGDDFSVLVRFERDVTAEPGGDSQRRSPSPSLYFVSAQAGG